MKKETLMKKTSNTIVDPSEVQNFEQIEIEEK